jgi:hypothetical protein
MLGFLFIACGGGELTVFPSQISWDEVDFQSSMPDEGYDARDISLTNTGTQNIELSLEAYDDIYLCLEGLDSGTQNLGILEPEQNYSLLVGVCGYQPDQGERDTEITGTLTITHNGNNDSIQIPWSFTPVLIIE